MSQALQMDPKVVELLSELARDPDSCLLRVRSNEASRTLFARDPLVRSSSAVLSRAERELLSVYRCEVAALLRQAYVAKLYAESSPTSGRVWRVTPTQVIRPVRFESWSQSVSRSLVDLPRAPEVDAGVELLEACVRTKSWGDVRVEQLAAAAHRLEPRDHGSIYAALAMFDAGNVAAARRVFENVLRGPSRRIDAAYAWVDFGMCVDLAGDPMTALTANLEASRLEPELVVARGNQVVFGVLADRMDTTRESVEWLDRDIRPDDPSVVSLGLSQVDMWQRGGSARFRLDVRRRAERIASSAGPTVRAVLHAFI